MEDTHLLPDDPPATARSVVPSLEEAMSPQPVFMECACAQVAPESVDFQMPPPFEHTTSNEPSLDTVTQRQLLELALAVHVAPESVDV